MPFAPSLLCANAQSRSSLLSRAGLTSPSRPSSTLQSLVAAQSSSQGHLLSPAEESGLLSNGLRTKQKCDDQLTGWQDSGDGYSPPTLLLAAGSRATALDWSQYGFKGCHVIVLDGSGGVGMGTRTLEYLKNMYGATVLKVPDNDKVLHCARLQYHTGCAACVYSEYDSTRTSILTLSRHSPAVHTTHFRLLLSVMVACMCHLYAFAHDRLVSCAVYHVSTSSHAVQIYLEKSCLGEIPPGPRAGTQATLLMAEALHEVYVLTETSLWGFAQGPGGTLLPYAQTSLHTMAGGVASDAVKAIYLRNTGFGSPQAYYASLQRSNAKLGTLQLSYCVLQPNGSEGMRVSYPGGLYMRPLTSPTSLQQNVGMPWGQRNIRLDGGVLDLGGRNATHPATLLLCLKPGKLKLAPQFYYRSSHGLKMRFYISSFDWAESIEDSLADSDTEE